MSVHPNIHIKKLIPVHQNLWTPGKDVIQHSHPNMSVCMLNWQWNWCCKRPIPFHFPADVLLPVSVTAAGSVDSQLTTWTSVSLSLGTEGQPSDEHSFPHSALFAELYEAETWLVLQHPNA